MDFRRAVLAMALGLLLLLIWQAWIDYDETRKREQLVQQHEAGQAVDVPDAPEVSVATQPVAPEGSEGVVPTVPSEGDSAPVPTVSAAGAERSVLESASRVKVVTDVLQVEIDTYGAEMRDVRLTAYPVDVDQPDVPFRMLQDNTSELLVAQSGLVGGSDFPNHKSQFEVSASSYELQDGSESLEVPFSWSAPDGVRYTKIYTFYRDSYLVDIEFIVENATDQLWRGFAYGQFLSTEHVVHNEGFWFFRALPSYRGAAIYTVEDKYDKVDYGDIRDSDLNVDTPSGWVAMLQHYFVTAWLPQGNGPYRLYTKTLDRNSARPRYQVGYVSLTPTDIAPGASGTLEAQLYVGPKDQSRIKDPAEGLILTVDYGWLTPVSSPLFWILDQINDVVKNWGWSIVLLTLLVKIVFYPLSAASYKSMAKMKKLQPRLKTLKERYGDDKQKMNQEMMSIYKKEKINPLGGCLPILIQIPVFIALYWVLLESVELRQAPFTLWLTDLSKSDPYYVLPVLMGASMFAQQFLNPTPLDTLQKNIMMSLPVVFTIFFLWFPAGLVLYWLVNNILSIAQQWYITRKLIPA